MSDDGRDASRSAGPGRPTAAADGEARLRLDGREVVLRMVDGRLSVEDEGTVTDLAAAEVLHALGSAPDWLAVASTVQRTLSRHLDVSVQEVVDAATSPATAKRLLAAPGHVPLWAWSVLAGHGTTTVRKGVAALIGTAPVPDGVIDALLVDPVSTVRRVTVERLPSVDPRLIRALQAPRTPQARVSQAGTLARAAVDRSDAPPALLVAIVGTRDLTAATAALAHPNTDAAVLDAAAATGVRALVERAVAHDAASHDLLSRAAAGDLGAPAQSALVMRARVPSEVLAKAAEGLLGPRAQEALLERPRLSQRLLRTVVDLRPDLHRGLAVHSLAEVSIATALVANGTRGRRALLTTGWHPSPQAAAAIVDDPDVVARLDLAVLPLLQKQWLRRLAADVAAEVRLTLIEHQPLPADVETRLAQDDDDRVRLAVHVLQRERAEGGVPPAGQGAPARPRTPRFVDPGPDARLRPGDSLADHHLSLPRIARALAAGSAEGRRALLGAAGRLSLEVTMAIAADPDVTARAELAAHPDLRMPVVQRLARDPAVAVRLALAEHQRALPRDVVERLARDDDLRVRAAAATQP